MANKVVNKSETVCIAGDFHIEYDDPKMRRLWFGFLENTQPDAVILNGDVIDFYGISRFSKDPDRATPKALRRELYRTRELLWMLRTLLPKARITYVQGNHEERLRKYLWTDAKALADLDELSLPALLRLDDFEVEYAEDGLWCGDLFVYHGSLVRKHSGYTARGELEKNGCSGLSNHTHRDGHHGVRNRGGIWGWWENFCMCDLNPEYVKGVANWIPGWSLVTVANRRPHVQQVMTAGYKYVWGDTMYSLTEKENKKWISYWKKNRRPKGVRDED